MGHNLLIIRGKIGLKTETYKENITEEQGREWGDASISQGISKIANKPPEAWRGMEQILLHSSQKEPAQLTA